MTKYCTWCNTDKPTSDFCRRSDTLDGYQYGCKQCRAEVKRMQRKNKNNTTS